MMSGLVDYGSGSDSESESTPIVVSSIPTPILPIASTSTLSLPPPKSNLPAKRSKGPVRIMLDLPPPSTTSTSTSDEPSKKKLKFTPSASGSGLSGLAAMLPAPKNESVAVKLEKALGEGTSDSTLGEEGKQQRTVSTGFVPYSLGKGKKPVVKPVVEEVDFFGLGSVSTNSIPSTSSYVAPKPLMTISSAPSINPTTTSSYGSAPTPEDPYPGFVLLPTGQWVAKDQETYVLWVTEHATREAESAAVPKGFEEKDILKNGGGMVDIEQEDWSQIPKILPRPGTEDDPNKPKAKPAPKLQGKAKGRHQLSSLLAEASTNREELEERIAAGRASRKGAGARYGF